MKKYNVSINDKKFIVKAQDELEAIKKVKDTIKDETLTKTVNLGKYNRYDTLIMKKANDYYLKLQGERNIVEVTGNPERIQDFVNFLNDYHSAGARITDSDTVKDTDFSSYYENQMNDFINNISKWKYRENGTTILCNTTPGQRRNIENKIENELKKVFPNKKYDVWSKLKSTNGRDRIGQLTGDKFYETNFEYRVKDSAIKDRNLSISEANEYQAQLNLLQKLYEEDKIDEKTYNKKVKELKSKYGIN